MYMYIVRGLFFEFMSSACSHSKILPSLKWLHCFEQRFFPPVGEHHAHGCVLQELVWME